jgi:hypothetical protein
MLATIEYASYYGCVSDQMEDFHHLFGGSAMGTSYFIFNLLVALMEPLLLASRPHSWWYYSY